MTCPNCGSDNLREPTVPNGGTLPAEHCRDCKHAWSSPAPNLGAHVLMARHHLTRREIDAVLEAADRMVDAALTVPPRKRDKSKPAYEGESADDVICRTTHDWRRQVTLLSIAGTIGARKIAENEEMTWTRQKRRQRA